LGVGGRGSGVGGRGSGVGGWWGWLSRGEQLIARFKEIFRSYVISPLISREKLAFGEKNHFLIP
jgi:hypothetical protein